MTSLLGEPGRFLRVALPLMVVLFALSGVWRFEEGTLGAVSAAAWAGFGVVLVVTFVFAVAALVYGRATRR